MTLLHHETNFNEKKNAIAPSPALSTMSWSALRQQLPLWRQQRTIQLSASFVTNRIYQVNGRNRLLYVSSLRSFSSCDDTAFEKSIIRSATKEKESKKSASPVALIFDTETSGMYHFPRPSTDSSQPDLVQLGMILVDTSTWVPKMKSSMLVELKDSQSISLAAENIHGISKEDCSRYGVPLSTAVEIFLSSLRKADVLVSHNSKFDQSIMETAFFRAMNRSDLWKKVPESKSTSSFLDGRVQSICTMKSTTELCKIPSKYGKNEYKWPSLAEAYNFTTSKELVGCHDALVDAEACLEIFHYLVENGHVSLENRRGEQFDHEGKATSILKTTAKISALQPNKEFNEQENVIKSAPETAANAAKDADTSGVFFVSGNTYRHRQVLKLRGGRWEPKKQVWKFYSAEALQTLHSPEFADLEITFL